MISQLRRKHQTTVRKRLAIPADRLAFVFLAVSALMNSLLPTATTCGQAPIPDFRTNGYAPPVHIPPRIPHYDPGLPETLNGRFNTTQQIRSQSESGLHANINDTTGLIASNEIPNQPVATNNYMGRNTVRATNVHTDQRQGTGLQNRISSLLSGNKTNKRKATRSNNNTQLQSVNARRVRGQHDSRPMLPEQTLAKATGTGVRQQTVSEPRRPSRPPQLDRATHQQLAQRSQRFGPAIPGQEYVVARHPKSVANQPIPNHQFAYGSQQRFVHRQNQPRNVQPASLQQAEGDQGRFVQNPFGTQQQGSSSGGAAFQSEFSSGQQSPRAVARQFRANLPSQKTTQGQLGRQTQLPIAQTLDKQQMEAISVLSNRPSAQDISLEPAMNFNGSAESTIPESFESHEFIESPFETNNGNVLRTPVSYQDDEDDSFAGQDDEADIDYTDDEGDSKGSPLRKSCEEFRQELLGKPLTDIALDISPPAKTDAFGANEFRVWRDQFGNELAQGTILDLRRGYLIVASGDGGQIRLPYARLSDADWLAISDYWKLPIECGLGPGTHNFRSWCPQTVTWHASALCHKPLYFENIQLERYGHSHGPFLQPIASAGHFFGKLFFLPYNTAINPPNECQYALGFYRPGNCAPWLKDPFPFSLAGASRQTLFYTGLGYLVD